jgi:hypothetical protein
LVYETYNEELLTNGKFPTAKADRAGGFSEKSRDENIL